MGLDTERKWFHPSSVQCSLRCPAVSTRKVLKPSVETPFCLLHNLRLDVFGPVEGLCEMVIYKPDPTPTNARMVETSVQKPKTQKASKYKAFQVQHDVTKENSIPNFPCQVPSQRQAH